MISNLVNGSRGSTTVVEEKSLTMSADSLVLSEDTSKISGEFNVFKSQYTTIRDGESSSNV